MKTAKFLLAAALPLALGAGMAHAEAHEEKDAKDKPAAADKMDMKGMSAEIMDREGNALGTVMLQPTASGQTMVKLELEGLPEGEHGVHIHQTGDCSADDFSSADGHLAGDKEHGVMAEGGPHPGDLPNVMVGSDGMVNVTYFKAGLDMGMVDDEDGSGFVVHAGSDDYESQPAGDAGDRIACGTFEAM